MKELNYEIHIMSRQENASNLDWREWGTQATLLQDAVLGDVQILIGSSHLSWSLVSYLQTLPSLPNMIPLFPVT